jgi:tetratricopeptide (TPR) repeat protein
MKPERSIPDAVRIPPSLTSTMNAGIACFNAGRTDEAIASFSEAIRREPRSLCGRYFRALAHAAAGRKDQAREDVRAMLELEPRSPFVRLRASRLFRQMGELDEDCLRFPPRALRGRLPARLRLEIVEELMIGGEYVEALAQCARALRASPDLWKARVRKVDLLMLLGQRSRAER